MIVLQQYPGNRNQDLQPPFFLPILLCLEQDKMSANLLIVSELTSESINPRLHIFLFHHYIFPPSTCNAPRYTLLYMRFFPSTFVKMLSFITEKSLDH